MAYAEIGSPGELRDLLGMPSGRAVTKERTRLHAVDREWLAVSPFCIVATADADGNCDASPKGDPAGFVRVLDERTLLIPDRPGNKLIDTLTNLLADDRIALLFLIPGVGDTFRVNGRAVITDDRELLEPCAVKGRAPRLGIVVTIEEAYTHCPKAMIRSELWNPERHIDRSELPSSGAIFRSLNDPSFDAEQYDRERAGRYQRREGLY